MTSTSNLNCIKCTLCPFFQQTAFFHYDNPSLLRQLGGKIADDIFKRIFVNENDWMSIKISLKFIPKCAIDNKSALVQVMAWHRQATSHYLNQCWPSSVTHICGTRGRWVNTMNTSSNRFSILIKRPEISKFLEKLLALWPVKNLPGSVDFTKHWSHICIE